MRQIKARLSDIKCGGRVGNPQNGLRAMAEIPPRQLSMLCKPLRHSHNRPLHG